MAELADVETSYVGLVERQQRVPSLDVLFRIAEAVGVALPELLSDAAIPPPRDPAEVEELRALILRWPKEHLQSLLTIARQLDRIRQR